MALVRAHPEKMFCNLGSGGSKGGPNLKNVDGYAGPNVDIVSDLHLIPFRDNSLDGITSVAVIEHLREPIQSVKETYRVLKPGALAHFNIPFMQPYHASPHDFQRFTSSGIRHLFRDFEIIKLECMGGPASAMVWICSEFLAIFLSFGLRWLHAVWFLFFTVTLWPFKYLDILLRRYPTSEIMTSNFSVLVRKPPKDTFR